MLYYFVKFLVNVFYRVFYKFEYEGLDKIPRGKPIVLAPNHVNAFIDPVVLAMLTKQEVRFFARGDVFKKPMAAWVLGKLNIFPMYRIQEGYSELKKNDKTFEICRTLLADNKTLLMFPEGICIQERRLRPLKKGLARIIFQTEETFDFKKDVLVVPIGLNYSDAKRFRSKLFIDCGDAISIKDYEEQYRKDKVRAINDFTKALEVKMAERLIIIDNKENDELVSAVEQIYMNDLLKEKKWKTTNLKSQYSAAREITEMINQTEKLRSDLTASLREKAVPYLNLLRENGLRDHLLSPDTISRMNMKTFLLEFIIVFFGLPLYWFGMATNYLPYFISKRVALKKSKNVEFLASLYMNMTMFLWIFYFIIQLVLVGLISRNWSVIGIYASMVVASGYIVLYFYPAMKKIFGRWRLLRMVRKDRETVEYLVKERGEIMEMINEMKRRFDRSSIKFR